MGKTRMTAAFAGATMLSWVAMADRTISENYTLTADEDWTGDGKITLSGNPTIDLAGYTLKVSAIAGTGTFVSSISDLTVPGGTVTSSGGFSDSYPATNLFDNDTGTLAVRTATSGEPLVVIYDLGNPTLVNCYRLYAAKPSTVSSPGFSAEWTFEGSNDGSAWTVLDTRTGQTLSNETWFRFDFNNSDAYRYYRMVVTKGSRWNSSTSKDPRIDFGGELELGVATRGKLSVNLTGVADSDLSGLSLSDGVDIQTYGDSLVLDGDLDMSGFPVSAAIDLNGHTLTVSSLSGGGTITDTSHLVEFIDLASSSGEISSSGGINDKYPATTLFDDDKETFALRGTTSADPIVVSYGFDSATVVNRYRIYAYTSVGSPGFPEDWTFDGSDDKENWTVLDTRTGESMSKGNWYSYEFANKVAYKYYRIRVTKGSRWNGTADPRLDVGGELDLGYRPAPGKVVVNVPSGKTVENTDVTLSGNLRLEKTGAGTLVVSKSEQTYLGGTEVAGGTLKCGAAVAGLFGAEGSEISIVANGIFDIAGIRASGVNALGKYSFMLYGGTLANSDSITGSRNYESPMRLALASDSSFDISSHGFIGTETAGLMGELDLGGHTFSGTIGEGLYFRINNMTMNNGAFKVENATTGRLFIGYGEGVVATNVDFTLNCPVVVRSTCSFKVRDYESLGGAANGSTQYGTMEVYGAFRPTSDCFYGCTLMDGATLDLSTRSTTLNALSASTGGLTNLAFAANATINVHIGARKTSASVPVFSWTAETKPANIDTVRFVRADEGRSYALVIKEDGLYAYTGLIISVR